MLHDTNGVVIGVVTKLKDPDGLGRVKVRYPNLGSVESEWARVVTPMAGPNRGLFFRPERDDEVLVAFEQGNARRPYILGGLWSLSDKPPPDDGKPTENNWRFVRSRSGHVVKLDDTKGGEKIEIVDKDGKRMVVIDSAKQKIQIVCKPGDVLIEASANLTITGKTVRVSAAGDMTIDAQGKLTISGSEVNIN